LQKEASEQLNLEMESQATFEFFGSQLKALKQAFETLSDVVMAEVDGVRKDACRRCRELEAEVNRQKECWKQSSSDIEQVKRTIDVWSLKERDWAKDNEILKASHSHNIEWMQQLQRDVMDTKDRVHEIKQEHSIRVKDLTEESANLRMHWQKQVELITERINEYDMTSQKHQVEARVQAQQRLDDLEIMEQALSSVQTQQIRLKMVIDEGQQSLQAEILSLSRRSESNEAKLSTSNSFIEQLKAKVHHMEKEHDQRMQSISNMFTVFIRFLKSLFAREFNNDDLTCWFSCKGLC